MASLSSLVLPTSTPSPSAQPIPLDPNHPTPAECKALNPPLSSLPRAINLALVIGISSPSDPDPLVTECCFPNAVQSLPPCWIWCELPTSGPLVPQPETGLGRTSGVSINGEVIGGNFSNCLVNGGTDPVERGLTFRVQGVTVGNGASINGDVSVNVSGASRVWAGGEGKVLGTAGLAMVVLLLAGVTI